jgi:hypothetical protein
VAEFTGDVEGHGPRVRGMTRPGANPPPSSSGLEFPRTFQERDSRSYGEQKGGGPVNFTEKHSGGRHPIVKGVMGPGTLLPSQQNRVSRKPRGMGFTSAAEGREGKGNGDDDAIWLCSILNGWGRERG